MGYDLVILVRIREEGRAPLTLAEGGGEIERPDGLSDHVWGEWCDKLVRRLSCDAEEALEGLADGLKDALALAPRATR